MRCSGWLAGTLVGAALVAAPAHADEPPVTDCDRLAAAPNLVPGVPGVAFADIDAAAAVEACGQALRDHPEVSRFSFQYGRALARAGDPAAAARLYQWAAADGYAPAQHALGQALQAGDGLPADPAEAERWLSAAAAQGYAPDASAEPPPSDPAATDADAGATELADSLKAIAEVLEGLPQAEPRARFDPLAVLQPAGVTVNALTAWVGREVVLVPYRGSLRGARGALMDRYANSLDRALLLAELLTAAGHQARLARATLDPAAAEALIAAFAPPPADDPPTIVRDALAAELIAAAGAFGDELGSQLAASDTSADSIAAAVDQRSAPLAQELLAALSDLPGDAGAARAEAVAAFSDHWWVQVQDGTAWVDADPSAAVSGPPAPVETFAAAADLPADLRHAVTLRMVVEFWESGQLREATLLTHDLVPADLIDRPVVLRHVPLTAPSPDTLLADTPPDQLVAATLAAAADAWVWQPVLTVGDEAAMDQLFTTRGEVLPAGPETLRSLGLDAGMFGELQQELEDVFGDGGAPEPVSAPDEASAPVRVTAEWLEIEIRTPGAPAAVHRRAVFDLLGPAPRASGTVADPAVGAPERLQRALGLLREVDILVTGAAPAASFVRSAMARDTADLLRGIEPLLREGDLASLVPPGGLPRLQLPLYRHALLRFPAEATPPAYQDRPNVVLAWSGVAGSGAADLRPTLLFDIVANDVSAPPAADAFAARVAQGVRDTVAEDALAGPGATGNAAALHAADQAAGRAWLRIDPAATDALAQLDLPPDAEAAIAADLAAGAVVLAPPAPVATPAGPQVAWWRIDPATGTTLGMSTAGGAAMTENAMLLAQGVQVGGCFVAMGMAISGGYGGLAVGAALCIAGGTTSAVAIIDGAALPAMIGAAVALGGVIAGAVSSY